MTTNTKLTPAQRRYLDAMTLTDHLSQGWGGYSSTRTVRVLEDRGLCRLNYFGNDPRWYAQITRLGRVLLEQPRDLFDSDAWYDDADGAIELWLAGFRPIEVQHVKPGMHVAYVTTMFGFHDGSQWQVAEVGDVAVDREHNDDGTSWISEVRVSHTGGVTDCDEGDEVWAK